ncbi:MAG: chromosome segregation protein SMC, partial [Oscillospiraceae bacterium]
RNDIGHAEGQIAELRSAVLSMSDSGGGFNAEIEAKQFSIDEKNAELTALDEIISKAQSELDSLIENNGISDRLRAEASKNLSALQAKITDLRVDSVSAVSSVELFKERAQTLESQLPEVQTRLAQAKTERAENEEYLSEIKRDSAECDNLIKGYTMKQDSRAAKLSEIAAELEKKQSQISEARNRANVLRDMEHSMEGFTNSVKKVSQASDQRELRGIVGTVASLITVREGCELAVETALGAAAQNIVVADERAAKQAIVFLKENRAGRATFLPLDTIKPSRFDDRVQLSQPGVVGLASELVSCDARFGDVMSSLLGRIIVAEELDSASVLAKKLGYRYRVVTMDGQVINAGGSYTGGFTARSAGIFSRKSEIEKLEAKANEIDNSCASTRAERDKLASERTVLEAQIQAASADLANHAEDRLRVQTRLAQLESEVQSFESSVAAIERELEKLAADRAEKERRTEQNDERLRDLLKEAERLENESGGDGADDFMKCRSELSELLSERRIERAEKQKDIESANYAIEQFEKQLTDAKGRAGEIEKTIASLEKDNHDAEQTIAQKQAEMESLGSAIAKYRADIDAAVSERAGNEREITETQARYAELTRQREEIARETSRLEERKVALQSEYDSANAKLWEEYELTRAEARGLCVEFESITSLRQQVASLRSRIRSLGNVNVGAIEEFKEVHERTEFLGAQVSDVERSRADLLKLIDSLEIEMKTIFTASFNEINTRFRKTFVELFGGGRANLYLSDESDVLESGIEIDVQPSGKVINNLAALSGGEQSLVAIAIYFAILGVNPSPFCILDEIDSALDESNVSRFANYLARVTERTQIIAITHRRGTMEAADVLYGVTMQEEGVSKLLRLDVDEARLVIAN